MEALKNGDLQLLQDLLNEKVLDDATSPGSRSSKGTTKKLVDVDAKYEDENEKTMLHIAADHENGEGVKVY